MYVRRYDVRAPLDLAALAVWTSPWIICPMAWQLVLNLTATNPNGPSAFTWELSHDRVNAIASGAVAQAALLQGDVIIAQALNGAGGRTSMLISNYQGGVIGGIPMWWARVNVTGHATLIITGLAATMAVAYLSKPIVVDDDTSVLG